MQNDLMSVILFIALIVIYCIHSKCKKKISAQNWMCQIWPDGNFLWLMNRVLEVRETSFFSICLLFTHVHLISIIFIHSFLQESLNTYLFLSYLSIVWGLTYLKQDSITINPLSGFMSIAISHTKVTAYEWPYLGQPLCRVGLPLFLKQMF